MEAIDNRYELAVTGGLCLTLDDLDTELQDCLILVREGKIDWIGETHDYPDPWVADRTIHARGGLILPALINGHTHLSLSLYRGIGTDLPLHDWLTKIIWPLEKRFCNPDNVYLGSCLSLLEMIRSGTGSLAAMDFFSLLAGKAIEDSGLRGFIGEALFSSPTPSISDPRDGLGVTQNLAARYHGHPMVHAMVVLHAPFTCSSGLYREASDFATSAGLKVCSHVAETSAEVARFRDNHRMSPVEWLDGAGVLHPDFIGIHCVHLSERDREILAARNVGVIHSPHSNMMLGSGICPVPDLVRRGIRVGLGTDSASSNNSLSMIGEMQTAAKLHKLAAKDSAILPAREVIRMATRVNADILGLKEVTGHLKAGMSADLVILDPHSANMIPLHDPYAQVVYSLENHDVETLVVGGRTVMENRRILTIDEKLILKEIRQWDRTSGIREFLSK